MTDEQLVEYLVKLRGDLHHHALRKPGIWHPDKVRQFHEEAVLLQEVVHAIAFDQAMTLLFAKERDEDLMRSAGDAGAITKVRVEAFGLMDGSRQELQHFVIALPSRRIDRAAIDQVHRHFRDQFRGGPKGVEVLEYRLLSENGSKVYAAWRRVPPRGPAQSS
jgi:hypothetical protein